MEDNPLSEIFGENLAKKKLKSMVLDPLDDSADEKTKKLYGYLVFLIKDKKYLRSTTKPELYIRIYNQFREWPEEMQKWIKDEYIYLQALKITNLSLNTHKNNYSGQLLDIINDLRPGDTKKSIDSLLDKLDSNQIYINEHFFNTIRYAMRQSPLTANECSRLWILLDEWSDIYSALLTEKKKKVKSQI